MTHQSCPTLGLAFIRHWVWAVCRRVLSKPRQLGIPRRQRLCHPQNHFTSPNSFLKHVAFVSELNAAHWESRHFADFGYFNPGYKCSLYNIRTPFSPFTLHWLFVISPLSLSTLFYSKGILKGPLMTRKPCRYKGHMCINKQSVYTDKWTLNVRQ